MNAEQLLERGANFAGNGLLNPLTILCELARLHCGDDHFRKDGTGKLVPHECGEAGKAYAVSMQALSKVAGGSLVTWYGLGGRSSAEVVALFEDALFNVQVGA